MRTWTCFDCETKMKVADVVIPKTCCACGSTNIAMTDFRKRLANYENYDKELESVTNELNALMDKAVPLHKRYQDIIVYFRQQKARGLLTEEEVQERAQKYKYLKHVNRGKKDINGTEV